MSFRGQTDYVASCLFVCFLGSVVFHFLNPCASVYQSLLGGLIATLVYVSIRFYMLVVIRSIEATIGASVASGDLERKA
jgi:hypothetical protein